ncbi:hypothetical protein J7E97_31530 [Streptomyces sp. ISL-66]|uniref:hypothetical protein n=1 Tax=Streptomyces sp. ISL-66 TaxID=2819186 RepID=UPI001BE65C5E|nr:hypothetical protein [Streptomyces sp. ISL-66]MBT2472266.1 hypothetical protein [Streptomyces sp. ISL-66]
MVRRPEGTWTLASTTDVLAEAAAEARAFGAGPAAAVDELVRGLLGQLADLAAVDRRAGPRAHHGN